MNLPSIEPLDLYPSVAASADTGELSRPVNVKERLSVSAARQRQDLETRHGRNNLSGSGEIETLPVRISGR